MSHLTEWGHFKNWIQPAIGEIPLKDLRPLHLERLKKTLLEAEKIDKDAPTKTVKNPKSPRTIQYIFATIRGAWNMARKHRVIEGDSPTKAVKKPKEMTAGKPEDLIFPGPGGEVFPQIPRHFSFNPGLTFTPSRKSWVMGPLP